MSSDDNVVDDRLSMFPEEITLHILSLMPTKYAVRTSILSTRWRYRWMFVTNLDFDDYHPINGHDMLKNFDMLKKLVNRVLELWKTPQVELFRLHLSRIWDSRIVEKWIDKGVRLNVRELDIQGLMLSLPLSFFTCKILTKLRLNSENCHYFLWKSRCLCPVNLPCLKTLDIVAYSNPFANAFKLIAGCPMLESLSLLVTKCNSEEDLIFNIPTLKRLKLSLSFIDHASVINKVVLNVPTLEYLFVDGLWSSSFVMEDESSPVNLPRLKTLDMVAYTNPFVNVFKLINGCPVLESLSLEITMCKYKKDFMFIIPTLKRLKLSFIKHASVLNKIVLNVPNLEYLFVHGVLSSSFVMEDVSSLVEASISCTQMRNHHLWFELLKGINGVQSLSAKNVISNIDFKIPLSSPLLVFPNMKHLELKDVCQYGQISHFLERCPELKHLRIGQVVEPLLKKRTRSSWIEPKFVPTCMLTNLTSIKFSNCNGQKPEIQFLEYILGKGEALKTVTITWENLCIEKEMNLGRHLLKVPRASLYCENHFLENHSLHLL